MSCARGHPLEITTDLLTGTTLSRCLVCEGEAAQRERRQRYLASAIEHVARHFQLDPAEVVARLTGTVAVRASTAPWPPGRPREIPCLRCGGAVPVARKGMIPTVHQGSCPRPTTGRCACGTTFPISRMGVIATQCRACRGALPPRLDRRPASAECEDCHEPFAMNPKGTPATRCPRCRLERKRAQCLDWYYRNTEGKRRRRGGPRTPAPSARPLVRPIA